MNELSHNPFSALAGRYAVEPPPPVPVIEQRGHEEPLLREVAPIVEDEPVGTAPVIELVPAAVAEWYRRCTGSPAWNTTCRECMTTVPRHLLTCAEHGAHPAA